MAFAVYRPPVDFARHEGDVNRPSRPVQVQVESPTETAMFPLDLIRPPVVQVHGLWDDSSAWDAFLAIPWTRYWYVRPVSYYQDLKGKIIVSDPVYPASVLDKAKANALGFAYNAPRVLERIAEKIGDFRMIHSAAAAQADVLAHSMGGLVVRTAETLPLYTSSSSFGIGSIHKLITIGVPHRGSPLATLLRVGPGHCVRDKLAKYGNISFHSVNIAGVGTVTGAIEDLQGDAPIGSPSPALTYLQIRNDNEAPTAFIAGKMTDVNVAGLDCVACDIRALKTLPESLGGCRSDPLAQALNSTAWRSVVFSDRDSDGMVSVPSQFANQPANSACTSQGGVIHSRGLTQLGFRSPFELQDLSGIPAMVVGFLDASLDPSQSLSSPHHPPTPPCPFSKPSQHPW